MKYILSDSDEVVSPPLHDSEIRSIVLEANGDSCIKFQLVNEDYITLRLHGVIRLKINDFSEGNIVLDVTVTKITDAPVCDILRAYGKTEKDSISNLTLEELKTDKALVVCLNPSYGASIVCICKSVDFE